MDLACVKNLVNMYSSLIDIYLTLDVNPIPHKRKSIGCLVQFLQKKGMIET